ncbi:MAG: hypothetical protein ABSC19_06305, partial [Syntrophorhabdales bacterium]
QSRGLAVCWPLKKRGPIANGNSSPIIILMKPEIMPISRLPVKSTIPQKSNSGSPPAKPGVYLNAIS